MRTARTASMPWWSSPAGIACGFLLPLMFLIAWAGEVRHPALTIRGVQVLDLGWLMLGGLLLAALALGGMLGAQLQPRAGAPRPLGVGADRAALAIGLVAVLAFSVWFRDFLLDPALLWATLSGAYKPERDSIELTPGLTSLANVTPVFFSLYLFRRLDPGGAGRGPALPLPRALHVLAIVLALLTAFRVYVWSERLALIESLVPLGLAVGRWAAARPGAAGTLLRVAGPFAAIPLVILYFGAAEYARSWASDTYQGRLDFWEFALGRFASYYYTSLNNGASLLANSAWPTWTFEFTLEWLHRAPLGLGQPFSTLTGYAGRTFEQHLFTYQDPEFNSPSGLYAVVSDLGLTGAVVYMCAAGLLSGMAFRAYREGRLAGVLLYPIFFISFMEMYRYPYLGTARAFTWTCGIVLALLLARVLAPAPAPASASASASTPEGRQP